MSLPPLIVTIWPDTSRYDAAMREALAQARAPRLARAVRRARAQRAHRMYRQRKRGRW